MRTTADYTFFFTEHECFSNWYRASFELDGQRFNCVEQAMMYAKAMHFGDTATAQRVMEVSHPKDQKALGRSVTPFNAAEWDAVGDDAVARACRAKFLQNPALMAQLMATQGTSLVEASPYDKIWGIGMGQWDAGVEDPANWKGIPGKNNKLGRILTAMRDALVAAQDLTTAVDEATPAANEPVITVRSRRPRM